MIRRDCGLLILPGDCCWISFLSYIVKGLLFCAGYILKCFLVEIGGGFGLVDPAVFEVVLASDMAVLSEEGRRANFGTVVVTENWTVGCEGVKFLHMNYKKPALRVVG